MLKNLSQMRLFGFIFILVLNISIVHGEVIPTNDIKIPQIVDVGIIKTREIKISINVEMLSDVPGILTVLKTDCPCLTVKREEFLLKKGTNQISLDGSLANGRFGFFRSTVAFDYVKNGLFIGNKLIEIKGWMRPELGFFVHMTSGIYGTDDLETFILSLEGEKSAIKDSQIVYDEKNYELLFDRDDAHENLSKVRRRIVAIKSKGTTAVPEMKISYDNKIIWP